MPKAVVFLILSAFASCTARPREIALPDVRQSTDYTCAAAALMSVLAYYGIEAREDRHPPAASSA